jgi:sugar (pentulose or hexulose) kinase
MGPVAFVLGLDVGSSVAKAALFDEDFTERAVASVSLAVDRSVSGLVEVDPEGVWQAVIQVVRAVVGRAGIDPSEILAVGVSAAMVGGFLLDARGRALRPGVNWEDARAQPLIDDIVAREPDALRRSFLSSGCALQQGCTLPVLAYLARTEPDMVARARSFVSLKDYVRARLTGVVAADRSEAAVAPGSAARRGRSPEMIELFGLSSLAHLLPEPRESETVGGEITAEAARATGLRAGTSVAIGAGDVPSTVIGAGGWGLGRATMILGTTAMVGVTHDRPVFEPPDLGLLFTLPGRHWYRAMVNVAGTLNLDWALSTLAPDLAGRPDRYDAVTRLVEAVPIGAEGVTFLPYLSDSGIIAPVLDRSARAGFAGLSPRHGRPQLLRAVFEGVAFSLADLLDRLRFDGDAVVLVGGGAKSSLWPRMIADLAGRSVHVPDGSEFGARGAALLAATAAGRFRTVADAAALVPPTRAVFEPDDAAAGAWAGPRAAFARHRDAALGRPP